MTELAPLIGLVGLMAASAGAAAYALLAERRRIATLARNGDSGDDDLTRSDIAGSVRRGIGAWIARRVPERWVPRGEVAQRLVHAGFDAPSAPAVYTAALLTTTFVVPLLAAVFGPRSDGRLLVLLVLLTALVRHLGPSAVVQRLAAIRRERLQRQLPDCLDFLVGCVEAGVSLDAAMLRVAREMAPVHPEISAELLQVSRRVNAGLAREQALEGMCKRTGVEELRALVANMVQSDRWGASIAVVLRVYAEGLRRRRKQGAEKKAATAPLKMMGPLVLFVFPVIFVVLLGPAVLRIGTLLGADR